MKQMNFIHKLLKTLGLLLFVTLLFACQKENDAIAPSEVEKWTYFNTSNGLPSNQINCIAEDGYNNIWIGTDNGLVKYDGSNFKYYSRETGLPSNKIYSLYWDRNSELLVGTHNGFGKISVTGSYKNILELPNLSVTKFSEDRKQECVYCATNIGVISYYYSIPDLNYTEIDSTLINGIYRPDPVYDIAVDNNNYTWIAAKKGVYVYTDTDKDKTFYSEDKLGFLCSISKLHNDKAGNVWVSSTCGQKVIYYNGTKFVNDSIFFGMNNYKSFAQDQYNNYWISIAKKGILNYGGGMTTVYNTTNSKIISNDINDIFYDSKKNIWFGSNDNGLMYYQNIKPLQFRFDAGNNSKITPNPIN